jgi:hypothetical protein
MDIIKKYSTRLNIRVSNKLKKYNIPKKVSRWFFIISGSILLLILLSYFGILKFNNILNIETFTNGINDNKQNGTKDGTKNETEDKSKPLDMKRPFLNILDDKGRKTNIVFITHPFSRDDCIENYNKGKEHNMQYLGISSYCDFPAIISNPHDAMHDPKHKAWTYNYYELCKGWCHCFREPAKYGIPPSFPQILLSESDFAKYNKHQPKPDVKKEYDFIYVCLKDNDKCEPGWQSYNRNWELAEKCLKIMCEKYHLKGLLVGRINCKLPSKCHTLMEQTDFLQYNDFISKYPKCRFAFVPNQLDASPRVMTEAICYNMPVLCNYNITGGWKYITEKTGEFFNRDGSNSGEDFEDALKTFLQKFDTYTPRDEYIKHHKEEDEGKRLLDFCKECIGKENFNFKCEEDGGDVKYLVPGI